MKGKEEQLQAKDTGIEMGLYFWPLLLKRHKS